MLFLLFDVLVCDAAGLKGGQVGRKLRIAERLLGGGAAELARMLAIRVVAGMCARVDVLWNIHVRNNQHRVFHAVRLRDCRYRVGLNARATPLVDRLLVKLVGDVEHLNLHMHKLAELQTCLGFLRRNGDVCGRLHFVCDRKWLFSEQVDLRLNRSLMFAHAKRALRNIDVCLLFDLVFEPNIAKVDVDRFVSGRNGHHSNHTIWAVILDPRLTKTRHMHRAHLLIVQHFPGLGETRQLHETCLCRRNHD